MKASLIEATTGLEYALPSPSGLEVPASPRASGGLEGASRLSRELASWSAPIISPDQQINPNKEILDARSSDRLMNDGYISGAEQMHRDNIVGSQFTLNSRPNYRALGLDFRWAEEFQIEVESKFALWANSVNNWPDAARKNDFTELVRLAVGAYFAGGEVLATAEWSRQSARPYKTMIQLIDPSRLSNPNYGSDTAYLRRGVERNALGEPLAYHIRSGHPSEFYSDAGNYTWKRVPTRKPWGRLQVIHIFEQLRIDQSRGVSAMVSVLKQMRMTQRFQDIVLQNAVVNATYAATIESELPPEAAYGQLGEGGTTTWATDFLEQIAAYSGSARNLHIDGVKIPHLFPGTKMKLQPAGQPGGVGDGFEQSLLRHVASALGLSYEQFSRDYTQTNYSSARASMNETYKFMQSRKKIVADRFATSMFHLWFEEALNTGQITTVPRNAPDFYEGLNREAYMACTWIGASRGQIDEKKETEAAVMRIKEGLSTYEKEAARLGEDFRELFAQQAREKQMREELGLIQSAEEIAAAAAAAQKPAQDKAQEQADDRQQKDDANAALLTAVVSAIAARPEANTTIHMPAAQAPEPPPPINVNVTSPPVTVQVGAKASGKKKHTFLEDEHGRVIGAVSEDLPEDEGSGLE